MSHPPDNSIPVAIYTKPGPLLRTTVTCAHVIENGHQDISKFSIQDCSNEPQLDVCQLLATSDASFSLAFKQKSEHICKQFHIPLLPFAPAQCCPIADSESIQPVDKDTQHK